MPRMTFDKGRSEMFTRNRPGLFRPPRVKNVAAKLCLVLLAALALVAVNGSSASAGTDDYPQKNDAWCTTN